MEELDALFERAARAPAAERIGEYRDRIASHGLAALPRLGEWLASAALGRFASRTLERIARDHPTDALAELRSGLISAPPGVSGEVAAAIERLDPPPRQRVTRSLKAREPRTWPNRELGHPYSDVVAYRVLNTNHHNDPRDDNYMLGEHRAAAFFGRWKHHIETIQPGDLVFLYRTGAGIVAMGQAVGPLQKRAYQGNPDHPEEEFYRELDPFQRVAPPVSAGEIKGVTDHPYSMRGTLFTLRPELGELLLIHLTGGHRA